MLAEFGVLQALPNNLLGGSQIGIQVGLHLLQCLFDGGAGGQLLIGLENLAKARGMLLQAAAHFVRAAWALVQAYQQGREDVGAQGVMHHVRFQMVAQGGQADLVVVHCRSCSSIIEQAVQAHE